MCAPPDTRRRAPSQVVDVGGGTGFCTLGVVQTVDPKNVTLIDQSPHQLEKARAKPALQGVTIMQVRASVCTQGTPACTAANDDDFGGNEQRGAMRASRVALHPCQCRSPPGAKAVFRARAVGGHAAARLYARSVLPSFDGSDYYWNDSSHRVAHTHTHAAAQGDAEELPFATDTFDRYTSAGSIEYWPEPQRGIREAYRVIKPGGIACVIGPVHPTFWLSRFFADVWML